MLKKIKGEKLKKGAVFKAIIVMVLLTGSIGSVHAQCVGDPGYWIVGDVIDSTDGTPADGHTVLVWYNDENKNDTDIIGSGGISNRYMADAEVASGGVPSVGYVYHLKVIDNGDGYTAGPIDVTIISDDLERGYALAGAMTLKGPVLACDQYGNERNQFVYGENVYVKGHGLSTSTDYKIWIQNEAVNESDVLDTMEDPSLSQETVTTDSNGILPPTLIWEIDLSSSEPLNEWDIVVDKQGEPETGIFNGASDGIDSAITYGFEAPVPELSTMILSGVGLLALAGYIGFRKRD